MEDNEFLDYVKKEFEDTLQKISDATGWDRKQIEEEIAKANDIEDLLDNVNLWGDDYE